MCKQGTQVRLWHSDIGTYDVDECIWKIVYALNAFGIRTVASCCGHGHRPGIIALADGRELVIVRDFNEARSIDTLFPDIHGVRL